MRLNQRCGSTSNVQIQIGLMVTAAGIEMSFTSSDTLWSYGRLRPLPSCWVIRMLGLGHPLDGLCVDGGLPCTPVMLGYPGVGPGCPPMAGLPTNPPPPQVTSSDHRPPALPRAPWGSTPPAMRVWGSRPSIASHPRRIPAHTPGYTGVPGPHPLRGGSRYRSCYKRNKRTLNYRQILLGGTAFMGERTPIRQIATSLWMWVVLFSEGR